MYGENSSALRLELATLLRQHRIQARIGGPGIHTVPVSTTVSQREYIAGLIQRYRFGVLTWCRQALAASGPTVAIDRREQSLRPDVALQRILAKSMRASSPSLPTLDELSTPHEFPLVEGWRLAARAAALGEHDFAGDLAQGRLDHGQCLTVTKDAAEVLRGLVVLDRRYRNVPGWRHLPLAPRLERAAEACALLVAADYSVDLRGWRPPVGTTISTADGRARRGMAGVVQAELEALIHLTHPPTALNLRRLLDAQREISHLLAIRTESLDRALSSRWARRASTYQALHRAARDIEGTVGAGTAAAVAASNAVSRLRRLPRDDVLDTTTRRDLDLLFSAVDRRLVEVIESGARERTYFLRTTLPRIVEDDGRLVHGARTRFTPIIAPMRADLVRLARAGLRPAPILPEPPEGARTSRQELAEALFHRPAPRPRRSGLSHPSL